MLEIYQGSPTTAMTRSQSRTNKGLTSLNYLRNKIVTWTWQIFDLKSFSTGWSTQLNSTQPETLPQTKNFSSTTTSHKTLSGFAITKQKKFSERTQKRKIWSINRCLSGQLQPAVVITSKPTQTTRAQRLPTTPCLTPLMRINSWANSSTMVCKPE